MKNIFKFSIIALSLFCILQSCSKDSQKPETTGPDPLWPEATMLWLGEDSVITIKDLSKLIKVTSSDEKVVKAAIQENGVKLLAGIPGAATIQITDDAGHTAMREVRSVTLEFTWRNDMSDLAYKTRVVVEANDPAFVNNLKDQLLTQTDALYAISFRPNLTGNGTDSFRQINYSSPSVTTSGTFTFSDLTLELSSAAGKTKYRVVPQKNRQLLGLEQDLTEYYKTLHPDKGIQKIIIVHYIKQYLPPG